MGVTLKLFIDKRNQKVLYAEAGKEFVDFLCHLMVLPVGVVVGLVENGNVGGSLGSLYNSIKSLDSSYVDPKCSTEFILNAPSFGSIVSLLSDSVSSAVKQMYVCYQNRKPSCRSYVSHLMYTPCPSCANHSMSEAVSSAEPLLWWQGGYVKSPASYMVMDDLAVMPLSTDTCFKLLNDAGGFERKEVDVGKDQVIKLVKALLDSKTVLTDVFLRD